MGSLDEPSKMKIKEIRIFPIKSIRGLTLPSHRATAMGFEYDRIFQLQRISDDKNMHVPHFPSMCLFTTELSPSVQEPQKVLVRYRFDHTFDQPEKKLDGPEVLEVPLKPDVDTLRKHKLLLHRSPADCYIMPEEMCRWFSDRLGFEVRLNYIGAAKRPVLGNLNPNSPQVWAGDVLDKSHLDATPSDSGWFSSVRNSVNNAIGTVASYSSGDPYKGVEDGLTFADIAAFLVVSQSSFDNAQKRMEEGIDMDKFRPNLVVEGAERDWEEDYWAEIAIGNQQKDDALRIVFTSNCARCASINVDYDTGKMATTDQGKLLSKLQSDRRVDPGHKYSPIFGRYGFMSTKNGRRPEQMVTISVGDEVQVIRRNEKRTHFYWPGLGTNK